MPSPLQRLTSWLCFAAALLAGSMPAQGFVVCLESDGCVGVELAATSAACSGCDGHRADGAPAAPSFRALQDDGCPCVDLVLPGAARDQRLLPKGVELELGLWSAIEAAVCIRADGPAEPALRGAPRVAPRPPDSLALIRSVVLLI